MSLSLSDGTTQVLSGESCIVVQHTHHDLELGTRVISRRSRNGSFNGVCDNVAYVLTGVINRLHDSV